jgi:hypothetical protein
MAMVVVFLAGAGAGTGCRTEGLAFRRDRRLSFVSPKDRARVRLPVVVRWKVNDVEGPHRYAVLVDRPPQPPGAGLGHYVGKDPACPSVAACLSPAYLAARGVYETTDTAFRIESIAPRVGVPKGQKDFHEVTVVLLDQNGKRIGESGVSVNLRLER